MGKLSKPTPEELKFVYGLIAEGYSVRDVLEEYSRLFENNELIYPFRTDGRFVKDRQKEFEAAKEVLTPKIEEKSEERLRARVKAEQDPVLAEAKKKHQAELLEFCGDWESGLGYFCQHAVWLFEDAALADVKRLESRSHFGSGSGMPLRVLYSTSGQDNPFTVDPWIEDDPFYESLRSHLSSDEYRPLWDAWSDLKESVVRQLATVEHRIKTGQLKHRDSRAHPHGDVAAWEEIEATLDDAVADFRTLLAQVRMRGLLPGRCDLCPEQALTTTRPPMCPPSQKSSTAWNSVTY